MSHGIPKKIAVINDFCGFGRCSLSVALPILSVMKIQCCPLPTAIFSNHTGYDSFFSADFTEHMNAYMEEWKKLNLHFDGVLTGFLGSAQQVQIVKRFFHLFPDGLHIIDPVMGDDGALYPGYSPQLAEEMASLLPYAHILTPNLTEACILTKTPYRANPEEAELIALCDTLSQMGPKKIVLSGLDRGDFLENFVYEYGKKPQVLRIRKAGPCRAGTGDVFSAILAADAVRGLPLGQSVQHAADFISKALRRTVELNFPAPDGIYFEEFLTEL